MADARTISEHLGGKKYGKSYRAPCPCHGGSNPTSLVITDAGDRTLVYCHAGCNQRDLIETLSSMGLWASVSHSDSFRRRQKEEHARIVLTLAESQLKRGKPLSEQDRATVDDALLLLKGASA